MTSMGIGSVALVLVTLVNFHHFPAISGLQCYGCAEGIQTPNRCKDFQKANETEKKSRFSMICNPAATGCAFLAFDIDNGQTRLKTSSLECYVPDARLMKLSKMGGCKETLDGKSKFKVCACDSGDYCMKGESPAGGGAFGIFATIALGLVAYFW